MRAKGIVGFGSVMLIVSYIKGLLQPERFHNSMAMFLLCLVGEVLQRKNISLFYERLDTFSSHSAALSVLSWQPATAFYSQHTSGVITSQFLSAANIRDPPKMCHLYHCKSIFIYFLQGLQLCPI